MLAIWTKFIVSFQGKLHIHMSISHQVSLTKQRSKPFLWKSFFNNSIALDVRWMHYNQRQNWNAAKIYHAHNWHHLSSWRTSSVNHLSSWSWSTIGIICQADLCYIRIQDQMQTRLRGPKEAEVLCGVGFLRTLRVGFRFFYPTPVVQLNHILHRTRN